MCRSDYEAEKEQKTKEYIEFLSSVLKGEYYEEINVEKNTFSFKNKNIILIQKTFRKFLGRKKFKNLLIEKLRMKNQILSSNINFKETWEIYFKKRNEYEFSLKGINQLIKDITNFYSTFFDLESIIASSYKISQEKMKTLSFHSILDKNFRKILMLYMQNSFLLREKIEKEIFGFEITIEEFEANEDEEEYEIESLRSPNLGYIDDNELKLNSISAFMFEESKASYDSYRNKNKNKNDNVINLISMESNQENFEKNKLLPSKFIKKFTVKQNWNKSDFQELIRKSQMSKLEKSSGVKFNNLVNLSPKSKSGANNLSIPEGKIQKRKSFKRLTQTENSDDTKVQLFSGKSSDKPYIVDFLEIIKNVQEKECIYTSFEDQITKVIYSGSFNPVTGTKEGLGVEYMLDSSKGTIYKYCGYFHQNQFQGVGLLCTDSNEAYYGEFRNGKKSGYGHYYSETKNYSGFFKDGIYEGYGEINVEGVYTYSGTWKDGKKHGFGFFISKEGATYCGEFSEGNIDGTGFFKWSDGQSYFGNWKAGVMEGLGEFKYKNGDRFVGNYKNDTKHGRGVYYFQNGITLKGRWIKGRKEGDFLFCNEKEKISVMIKYVNDVQTRI